MIPGSYMPSPRRSPRIYQRRFPNLGLRQLISMAGTLTAPEAIKGAYRVGQLMKQGYSLFKSRPRINRGAIGPARSVATSKKRKSVAKPRAAKKFKQIVQKVQKLEKRVKEGETTFIYRVSRGDKMQALIKTNFGSLGYLNISKTEIEDCMSRLQFWDEATSTFITRSIVNVNDQHSVNIDYASINVKCVNNYQVPVTFDVYYCKPKTDTSIDPNIQMSQGIEDIVTDPVNMVANNRLIRLSDSKDLMTNWSFKKIKRVTLVGGGSYEFTHSEKDIAYDPTTVGTEKWQKKLKCGFIAIYIVDGLTIGHEAVANPTSQIILRRGIDMVVTNIFRVRYDGGINATRLYVSDTTDGTTQGGVIGVGNTKDNLAYTGL